MNRRKFLQAAGFGAGGLATISSKAQAMTGFILASSAFDLDFDRSTGAITSIVHPHDTARMNWTSSRENAPWQAESLRWGLGYTDLGGPTMHRRWWQIPSQMNVAADQRSMSVVYLVGDLKLEVSRSLDEDSFHESYVFSNVGSKLLRIDSEAGRGTAIALPFNDHYTSATDVLEHRAHTHIWCGESSSWIACMRMGGRPPHLGLVLTEGALWSYSIADRDQITSSNTRGNFLFHPSIHTLKAGESYAVGWRCFWHTGWPDFFAQAQSRSRQFMRLETDHATFHPGETVAVRFTGQQSDGARFEEDLPFKASGLGEKTLQLRYGNGFRTKAVINVCPPLHELVRSRVHFITAKQQINDPDDPLYGAYLVYDNQMEEVVRRDWGNDRNEGRERVGMGVLIARWLQQNLDADPAISASLARYYDFVSTKLQEPDGTVLNGVYSKEVRLYNWPWVAQFHLEMAKLTGSPECLARFVKTIESYYANGGERFYAIGLPVFEGLTVLKATDRTVDYAKVRRLFESHAERIMATGRNYPASEVNFEQSIVGPAAILLLELCRASGELRWLEGGKVQLAMLELFNGRQPDHHLYEIAIRHWDDYWFGKANMWGDTQPHYWSSLTAVAFAHYAAITGETSYSARAETIIRNNLSLFSASGRGSAAFVYPASVNGQQAHFYDVYANDQDWALVHGLIVEACKKPQAVAVPIDVSVDSAIKAKFGRSSA